jgi:hypothetical protein
MFRSNERILSSVGARQLTSFMAELTWSPLTEEFPRTPNHTDQETKFPSWSWASSKAKQSPGNKNQMEIISWWEGDIVDATEICNVHVTHRAGPQMNLAAFSLQSDSYFKFHPWIDVTSWTIKGHIDMRRKNERDPRIGVGSIDREPTHVKFDPEFQQWKEWAEKEVLAVFLLGHASGDVWGRSRLTFRGLLLKESESGVYSRIGIWSAPTRESGHSDARWRHESVFLRRKEIGRLLEQWSVVVDGILEGIWQWETIRIV